MDEKDPPLQQTAQPQPSTHLSTPEAASSSEEQRSSVEGEANAVLDDARGTAGLMELYHELLKAPIPEDMLRLVRELEAKERK